MVQLKNNKLLARIIQKWDNAIHWINHCPVYSVVCFVNICPLVCDFQPLGPEPLQLTVVTKGPSVEGWWSEPRVRILIYFLIIVS